jgi:hypothetical protein
MYLRGLGGTRKSRVIEAIVTLFERVDYREKLLIIATIGCAANLIRGSTIDSVCSLGRRKKEKSKGMNDANIDDESIEIAVDNS